VPFQSGTPRLIFGARRSLRFTGNNPTDKRHHVTTQLTLSYFTMHNPSAAHTGCPDHRLFFENLHQIRSLKNLTVS
jgi:hypothetical protein